ncbi:MAG TPA: hypothetical protein DCR48_02285 [Flavobacteriales bacterium]|nr:hypothetical protein [Flavobacteriales bacterium]
MKFLSLFLLITSLSIISISTLKAQTYDEHYTVDYINSQLEKKCHVFTEKKNIRVEFYAGGVPVRIDYLFPKSLDFDNGIYFSESEGSVIVSCYEKAGKCIERDIIKRDSKIVYDRTNLTTTCTNGCAGLVEAMKHLIKLYVLDDVERTEPFE